MWCPCQLSRKSCILAFAVAGCVWTVWVQPVLGHGWGKVQWGQRSLLRDRLSGNGITWAPSTTSHFCCSPCAHHPQGSPNAASPRDLQQSLGLLGSTLGSSMSPQLFTQTMYMQFWSFKSGTVLPTLLLSPTKVGPPIHVLHLSPSLPLKGRSTSSRTILTPHLLTTTLFALASELNISFSSA